VEKILNVFVRRGLGAGAKIKFRSVGDHVPGEGKQDFHFVIQEVSQIPEMNSHCASINSPTS